MADFEKKLEKSRVFFPHQTIASQSGQDCQVNPSLARWSDDFSTSRELHHSRGLHLLDPWRKVKTNTQSGWRTVEWWRWLLVTGRVTEVASLSVGV